MYDYSDVPSWMNGKYKFSYHPINDYAHDRGMPRMPSIMEKNLSYKTRSFTIGMDIGGYECRDIVTESAFNRIYIEDTSSKDMFIHIHDNKVDFFTYYDDYHGKTRLNIAVHGFFSEDNPQLGGRVLINGEWVGSKEVVEISRHFMRQRSFGTIRMISCYSGLGGKHSLISEVSHQMQMPVKGYKGTVVGTNMDIMSKVINDYGHYRGRSILKSVEGIGRVQTLSDIGGGVLSPMTKTVMAGIEKW